VRGIAGEPLQPLPRLVPPAAGVDRLGQRPQLSRAAAPATAPRRQRGRAPHPLHRRNEPRTASQSPRRRAPASSAATSAHWNASPALVEPDKCRTRHHQPLAAVRRADHRASTAEAG